LTFDFLDGVITKYPVPKIPISNIVDSNGAGDAFIGGKISFDKQKNVVYFIYRYFKKYFSPRFY